MCSDLVISRVLALPSHQSLWAIGLTLEQALIRHSIEWHASSWEFQNNCAPLQNAQDRQGCMFACLHICMFARLHVCMFARLHVCTFARLHVCMFARLHVCMFARLHVCMFACLPTQTHMARWWLSSHLSPVIPLHSSTACSLDHGFQRRELQ